MMTMITEFFVLIYLLTWLFTMFQKSKVDGTDESRRKRSGLLLYVDHGTGVEYVATPFGGLTPRVDTEGKPIIHGNHLSE